MARVPDVRGSSVDSAERRLQNVENFAVRRYGDLIDEDEVTMQRPAPGSELERGGTITLDGRVGVPNVQGQRIFAGRNEIQSAPGNLDVVFNSEPTENDLVWGQVPDAGTRLSTFARDADPRRARAAAVWYVAKPGGDGPGQCGTRCMDRRQQHS